MTTPSAASPRQSPLIAPLMQPRRAIVLLTLASAGLLGGAWWFQLVVGLEPCKLCLQQRWPHYAALLAGIVSLGAAMALPAMKPRVLAAGLVVLAMLFLVSAVMGAYHAGVEWQWWPGPADCAAAPGLRAASTADFLAQLQGVRVVNCAEAPWRWLGLSLAGYNAIASLGLAVFAWLASQQGRSTAHHGSSSVSQ